MTRRRANSRTAASRFRSLRVNHFALGRKAGFSLESSGLRVRASTVEKRSRDKDQRCRSRRRPSLNAKAVLQSTTDKFVLRFHEMENRLVRTRGKLDKASWKAGRRLE